MKKCILVTGGAGFIGSALSHQLVDHDLPFVAFDNLHPQIHETRDRPDSLSSAAELFVGDVCVGEDWERFLALYEPVIVVHLAAETGTGQSLTESTRHAEVNVVGTAQMLDAFSRHSIKPARIVLSSSRAIYGEGAWRKDGGEVFYPGQRNAAMLERGEWDFAGAKALPFDARETQANPTSVYGATKLAQEHVLASWCRSFQIPYAILRLQNVYGPGQSLNNPYTGIVPLFSRLARDGKSIPLYEDGAMLRDFVYIDDVAAAIRLAMTAPAAIEEPLDIGTGSSISIGELAAIVSRRYGAPAPHVCGLFRNGDVRHAACQPQAAISALDWHPLTMAPEGIPMLCQWLDAELEKKAGAKS
jgi:dTDP-L-rhamnose 4-epimerase